MKNPIPLSNATTDKDMNYYVILMFSFSYLLYFIIYNTNIQQKL